ncbi:hypothetical protein L2090_21220 [Rahnella victoriana]|nr:hypothetical protein [Rahnella victoriana]
MDTKAAFEKWYAEFTSFREMLPGDKEIMFSSWTASRAAIEIPSSSDSEYWFEGTFQRMRYERDVEKAITSHGIKVKS